MKWWLGLGLVVSALVLACSSSEPAAGQTGGASTTPTTCPAQSVGPRLVSGLPSGACSDDGKACEYLASPCDIPKGDDDFGFRIDGYTCTCAHAAWACAMTSQGAGLCGGFDAGSTAKDAAPPPGPATCPAQPSGARRASALPSGACASAGLVCPYLASPCDIPDGGSDYGSQVNGYDCTCTGGAWTCAVTSVGGGMCAGAPVDAGPDH